MLRSRVEAHVLGRVREALLMYDMPDSAVSLSARLVEDLLIEQGSSVEDDMFDFLVDDFGWPFIKPADEATLVTVEDLVDYFMGHWTDEGEVVRRLSEPLAR